MAIFNEDQIVPLHEKDVKSSLWKEVVQLFRRSMQNKMFGCGTSAQIKNKRLLFHQTTETDLYIGEVGFDCRFSSKGRWEQVNYFAEDAKFADSYYANVQSEGLKQIMVTNVLIGNSYFSIPDNRNTVIGNMLFLE